MKLNRLMYELTEKTIDQAASKILYGSNPVAVWEMCFLALTSFIIYFVRREYFGE